MAAPMTNGVSLVPIVPLLAPDRTTVARNGTAMGALAATAPAAPNSAARRQPSTEVPRRGPPGTLTAIATTTVSNKGHEACTKVVEPAECRRVNMIASPSTAAHAPVAAASLHPQRTATVTAIQPAMRNHVVVGWAIGVVSTPRKNHPRSDAT